MALKGRNSSFGLPFIIFSLVVCWASTAAADEEMARERMLQLSDEATQAVLDGQFEEGAFKFRQAYDTFPDPVLLKNEMVAWFRAGNCMGALPAASAYLQSPDMTESDRLDVHKVQFTCLTLLTDDALQGGHYDEAQLLIADLNALTLSAEERQQSAELQARLDELRPSEVEDPGPEPAPKEFSIDQTMIGWALTGTGSAIVVGALLYHIKILGEQSELREADSMESFLALQEKYDKPHNRARIVVPTLYVLGAAALGTGVYFLINEEKSSDKKFLVSPVFSPGYGGATVQMQF